MLLRSVVPALLAVAELVLAQESFSSLASCGVRNLLQFLFTFFCAPNPAFLCRP